MSKIILVAGNACSGKDTFADALKSVIEDYAPNLKVNRFAFADKLKKDLEPFFSEKFETNIWKLEGEEKEVYRPFLVAYGRIQRSRTAGQYFIDYLEKALRINSVDILVVSDCRFPNELEWGKKNRGLSVHLRRFENVDGKKVYFKPANEEEKKNDPLVKKLADDGLIWGENSEEEIREIVEEFYLNNINFFINA